MRRASLVTALALGAASCGASVSGGGGDGGGGGAVDAGGGGGGDGGGGGGPDATTLFGPWLTPPTPVPGAATTTFSEDDASLSTDERELIFARRPVGTGNKDLMVMRKDSAGVWGAPTLIAELDDAESNSTPRLSPDGLTLYFASNRAGGNGGAEDLWMSTRTSSTAPWTAPTPMPLINSGGNDRWLAPCTSPVGSVFASTRAGGQGGLDLYGLDAGGAPTNATALNSNATDFGPWLSADCTTLYFSSNRSGDYELYLATRTAPGQPWNLVGVAPELVDPLDYTDPWRSADGARLYLSITKANNANDLDLYMTSRPPQ
ncbi:MAG: PD40 domain-containing protein [Kofleriaceae bacterium]|nr:PD40 domain-containing protein [Kofleriaceae bacterium]